MRVVVAGSRTIEEDISMLIMRLLPEDTTLLISGGARGVDTQAEKVARALGIECEIMLPDYKILGKAAPLERDRAMVDSADLVIAIWDGISRGTRYTVSYALDKKVPLVLCRYFASKHAEDQTLELYNFPDVLPDGN